MCIISIRGSDMDVIIYTHLTLYNSYNIINKKNLRIYLFLMNYNANETN
jgi:hypothetical protein